MSIDCIEGGAVSVFIDLPVGWQTRLRAAMQEEKKVEERNKRETTPPLPLPLPPLPPLPLFIPLERLSHPPRDRLLLMLFLDVVLSP